MTHRICTNLIEFFRDLRVERYFYVTFQYIRLYFLDGGINQCEHLNFRYSYNKVCSFLLVLVELLTKD